MAAPASTECRHPEASEEAIGGSAGAAADHMHAATAGVVAAARAEPPAEIECRSCRTEWGRSHRTPPWPTENSRTLET